MPYNSRVEINGNKTNKEEEIAREKKACAHQEKLNEFERTNDWKKERNKDRRQQRCEQKRMRKNEWEKNVHI